MTTKNQMRKRITFIRDGLRELSRHIDTDSWDLAADTIPELRGDLEVIAEAIEQRTGKQI